jgi:hypothetical protein
MHRAPLGARNSLSLPKPSDLLSRQSWTISTASQCRSMPRTFYQAVLRLTLMTPRYTPPLPDAAPNSSPSPVSAGEKNAQALLNRFEAFWGGAIPANRYRPRRLVGSPAAQRQQWLPNGLATLQPQYPRWVEEPTRTALLDGGSGSIGWRKVVVLPPVELSRLPIPSLLARHAMGPALLGRRTLQW